MPLSTLTLKKLSDYCILILIKAKHFTIEGAYMDNLYVNDDNEALSEMTIEEEMDIIGGDKTFLGLELGLAIIKYFSGDKK